MLFDNYCTVYCTYERDYNIPRQYFVLRFSYIQCISEPGKGTGIGTWDRERDTNRDMGQGKGHE